MKFKNIVAESFGIILLVFGIEKLRVAMRSEEYLAIFNNDMDKYEFLKLLESC
ncbi:hypothetical protein MNBD_BACTEROID02-1353 [hydrothermal vent metagenome]|uniref:Uncharacterized protein n=1 Tax=hydrothermal vent metagenome TaxID=652676 RepID=A0A3B0QVR7_9ZZZZ